MKNKRFVSTMPHSNFNLSSDRGREPVLFSSEGILMESKTNSDVILNHDDSNVKRTESTEKPKFNSIHGNRKDYPSNPSMYRKMLDNLARKKAARDI